MSRPEDVFNVQQEILSHGLDLPPDVGPGVIPHDDFADPDFLNNEANKFEVNYWNREPLPVDAYQEIITDAVRENPVTIVVAETGAGKSTRIPQFLLGEGYQRVYETQPRRPAAHQVRERMSDELSEVRYMSPFAGDELVSYQTAAGREGPEDARIQVVTDGLQLVRELHGRGVLDGEVLIIDEVHEWNSNVELLVAWTKQAIARRSGLRVVIMSATMDAHNLAEYYGRETDLEPPIIEVPGRAHRVEKLAAPESTVTDEIIKSILATAGSDGQLAPTPNATLAFLPGKREIHDTLDAVRARLPRHLVDKVLLFPLHAKMAKEDQQKAITEYPGYIKVVAATNVAQTSITIPDIKHVIDSGLERQMQVDDEGTRSLVAVTSSRASCLQKAGRTGRVADGIYALTRLGPDQQFTSLENRPAYPIPEMLRTSVDRSQLRLKALGMDLVNLELYHQPPASVIEMANHSLRILGALDDREQITPIGLKMNQFPLSPSSARIMVEAGQYNQEIRAYLAAAMASREAGGLRYFSQNAGRRWEALTDEATSDSLAQLDIFIATQGLTRRELKDYDLDINNVDRAREQFNKIARLADAPADRLIPPTDEQRQLIKDCLYAGFTPHIYKKIGDNYSHIGEPQLPTPREISRRSLVAGLPDFVVGEPYRVEFLDGEVGHYIEDVTVVTAFRLGQLAAKLTTWQPVEYVLHDGKIFDRQQLTLFGSRLGIVQEVLAEPSPKLRRAVIDFAIANPGVEQSRLREVKSQLERLAHLAKDPVPQLTHGQLLAIIESVAPPDITLPSTIEDNLRLRSFDPETRVELDDYISPESREQIIKNAPARLDLGGITLRLNYRHGVPIARQYDETLVPYLEDEVFLSDGRHVLFSRRNDSKKYTLFELKEKLGHDS